MRESPLLKLRLLDHWDDLDGHIERGYAGASIWDWHKLPDWLDPRYTDYARANASIGINGSVLNNVRANALSLTPLYLEKAAALAGVVPVQIGAALKLPTMLAEPPVRLKSV